MASYISQIKPGEYSTNAQLQADLGNRVCLDGGEYVLCKTISAIAAAGGKPVTGSFANGVYTWGVDVPTTALDAGVLGGIPIAPTTFVGYIDSTVTVPVSAYLLIQYYGPGKVTANTTVTAGALFGTVASAYVASVDSLVYGGAGVKGRTTNTAVATAAGGVVSCVWYA